MFYILLGIGAVVAAVCTYFTVWDTTDWRGRRQGFSWGKVFGTPVAFTVGLLLAFAIALMICMVAGGFAGHDHVDGDSRELQAINMTSDTQGSFFLGTGYVGEELTYSFYVKNGDGSFEVDSIRADEAKIIETDGAPRIQDILVMMPEWIMPDLADFAEWDTNYVIYVPQGSIAPIIDMELPQ